MEERKQEKMVNVKVKIRGYKKMQRKLREMREEAERLNAALERCELSRRKVLDNIEKPDKIFFLCDGNVPRCSRKTCYKNGKDGECKYTSDVTHAVNFKRQERIFTEIDREAGEHEQ